MEGDKERFEKSRIEESVAKFYTTLYALKIDPTDQRAKRIQQDLLSKIEKVLDPGLETTTALESKIEKANYMRPY